MKRLGCALALAFVLLVAAGTFIVLTKQLSMPPTPSYLPQVDRR